MKRRVLAWILSLVILMASLPVPALSEGDENITTPAPVVETSADQQDSDNPEPDAEEPPVVTEAPRDMDAPLITEAPVESENTEEAGGEPAETEEPTVAEDPAVTEEPVVTEAPEITEEPEATEEPIATPEPEELSVSLTKDVRSAFAGDTVSLHLSVGGGAGEVAVTYAVLHNGVEQSQTEPKSVSGGADTYSFVPSAYGEYTIVAKVTDVVKNEEGETVFERGANASVTLIVAEHDDGSDMAHYTALAANVELTGDWRQDILNIALSQLGYEESTRDFILREDGSKHGYTIYGEYYGMAYEEWCAMFVSFCAEYAGIPAKWFPRQSAVAQMMADMQKQDVFESIASDYEPVAGDIIFFERDGRPGHVGIVSDVKSGKVYTVEGNAGKAVAKREYTLNDSTILGYASMEALMNKAVGTPAMMAAVPLSIFFDNAILNPTLGSTTSVRLQTGGYDEVKVDYAVHEGLIDDDEALAEIVDQLDQGDGWQSSGVLNGSNMYNWENYTFKAEKSGIFTVIARGTRTADSATAIAVIIAVVAEDDSESLTAQLEQANGAAKTGDWIEDMIAIAGTQVGYEQSAKDIRGTLNMSTGEVALSYASAYGYWWKANKNGSISDKYGEWSAKFIAFCAALAGAPESEIPQKSTVSSLLSAVKSMGTFKNAGYTPKQGDLIFIKEGNSVVRAGIVTADADGSVSTIEGYAANGDTYVVETGSYALTSDQIAGYGCINMQIGPEEGVAKIKRPGDEKAYEDGFIYYSNLQSAVSDATDGEEIVLMKDIEVAEQVASNGRSYVLEFDNHTITAPVGGFLIVGGDVTMKNGKITGVNSNVPDFGAIDATDSNLTLDKMEIIGNKAYFGGGIVLDDTSAIITHSKISNNSSFSSSQNYATGLWIVGSLSEVTLEDVEFANNDAKYSALCVDSGGKLTATDCMFTGTKGANTSTNLSVIRMNGGEATFNNCEITGNKTNLKYLVYVTSAASVTFDEGSEIHENESVLGAIYNYGGKVTLKDVRIENNNATNTSKSTAATYYTGAVVHALASGTTTVEDAVITGNTANPVGKNVGGVYVGATGFTMKSGAIYGNGDGDSTRANDMYVAKNAKPALINPQMFKDGVKSFAGLFWLELGGVYTNRTSIAAGGEHYLTVGEAVRPDNPVAKIDRVVDDETITVYYSTVSDAINDVNMPEAGGTPETVTILDTAPNPITETIKVTNKSFILDMNGKTIDAEGKGTGLYVTIANSYASTNVVVIKNGTMTNGVPNSGWYGGNMYVSGADLTLENMKFTDGSADYGAGVYVYNGTALTIKDSEFTGNAGKNYGAAVYVSLGSYNKAVLDGVKVEENTLSGTSYCSLVYLGQTTAYEIKGGSFSNNTSINSAGSVLNLEGEGSVTGATIQNNKNFFYPVDVSIDVSSGGNGASMTMNGGTISGNVAYYAGAINVGGSATVNGTEITGNTVDRSGKTGNSTYYAGAIRQNSGTLEVTGAEISGNTAIHDTGSSHFGAGAIAINRGNATVTNTLIEENTINMPVSNASYANAVGGILFGNSATKLTLTNTVIRNNRANGNEATASNYCHPAGGVGINGTGFTMKGGAIYGNLAPIARKNYISNDLYVVSSANPTVVAADQMVDGSKDFEDYIWYDANLASARTSAEIKAGGSTLYLTAMKKLVRGVAMYNGEVYTTMQDAVDAVKADADAGIEIDPIITLVAGEYDDESSPLHGVTSFDSAETKIETPVTIDLNGKTINLDAVTKALGLLFDVVGDGALTLTGTGTLEGKIVVENLSTLTLGSNTNALSVSVIASGREDGSYPIAFEEGFKASGLTIELDAETLAIINEDKTDKDTEEDKVPTIVILGSNAEGLIDAANVTVKGITNFRVITTINEEGELILINPPVAEGIFMSTTGSDDDGTGAFEAPVATFEKAKELAMDSELHLIYILGSIQINGTETWAGDDDYPITIERYATTGRVTGTDMITVLGTGELTLGANLTIDGRKDIFTNCGSIVEVKANGTLVIDGATLQNNDVRETSAGGGYIVDATGGAVFSRGHITMKSGTIQDCAAYNGGGIFCLGNGTFDMLGGTIQNNTASQNKAGTSAGNGGGAAIAGGTRMTMSGGAFANNYARGQGGGLSIGPSVSGSGMYNTLTGGDFNFVMAGGTFTGNKAQSSGGGLLIQETLNSDGDRGYWAEIRGGLFENNYSYRGNFSGGGIYVNGGTNTGGVRNGHNAVLYIYDVEITGNTTAATGTLGFDGGAGYAACGTSTTFMGNSAMIYGNTNNGLFSTYASDVKISTSRGPGSGTSSPEYSLPEFMLDGTPYHWIKRGAGYVSNDTLKQDGVSVELYTNETPGNTSRAKVRIVGNHASGMGGGIASNGEVYFGSTGNVTINVDKVWKNNIQPANLKQINMWVVRNDSNDASRLVIYQVLNGDSVTFTGLDELGANESYTVIEEAIFEEVGEDGVAHVTHVWSADGKACESDILAYMNEVSANAGDSEITMMWSDDPESPNKDTREGNANEGFTITNQPVGGLEVSKTVEGSYGKEKQFAFKVILSDKSISGEYGDMTFDEGVAEFKLAHGEKKVAKGLPADITYTVEESDNDGYKVTKVGDEGTIIAGKVAGAAFTNSRELGELEISKTVEGRDGDKTKPFTFTVTLYEKLDNENKEIAEYVNGDDFIGIKYSAENSQGEKVKVEFTEGVATFTLKHGERIVLKDLPINLFYTVEETDNAGYTVDFKGSTGKIAGEQPSVVTFTNTRETGKLSIKKTVVEEAPDPNRVFTFTVTLKNADGTPAAINGTYGDMVFENGVATVTMSANETKTAKELPTGLKYEVVEDEESEYDTADTGNANGQITKNTTPLVEFTNTRKTGDLEVSKAVEGPANPEDEFTFTVTLMDDDGVAKYIDNATFSAEGSEVESVTFVQGMATITLKADESVKITGLPAGITYAVSETKKTDTNYEDVADQTGEIPADNTASAAFTNIRKTGDLEIEKTVEGKDGDKTKFFTFTVTLKDGEDVAEYIDGNDGTFAVENLAGITEIVFTKGEATIELKHGQKAKIVGLPANLSYEIVEKADDEYGVGSTGANGQIKEDNTIARFINTRKTGDLTVSKLVTGAGADYGKVFEFTVTLKNADGTLAEWISGEYGDMTFENGVAVITLKHNESATATGLPTGITYEVVETEDSDFSADPANGATGAIEDKKESKAAFVNTWKQGDLTVSKSVTGPGDQSKEFNFKVTLENADGTPYNGEHEVIHKDIEGTETEYTVKFDGGVYEFTLNHGASLTFVELPKNVKYTVEEETETGYTTTSTGETGVIADEPAVAVFTNERDTGSLKVSKAVDGKDATSDDYEKSFEFTVTLTNADGTPAAISGEFGDMVFEDGKATFTLKNGQTLTATGLPTGIAYTVTEKSDDSFTTESTGDTGTIEKDAEPEASFINTRKTQISVEKVWDDADNQDGIRPSSITVRLLADEDAYGDLIELSAANGWTYTWTELPVKRAGEVIEYTVEEVEVPEGYVANVTKGNTTDFVITNSYTPDTTQISVEKVWADAENQDGIRPSSITVQLLANGDAYGDAIELSDAAGWSYTWTDLPKKANGKDITYTVDETSDLPEGYVSSVTKDETNGFVITNSYTPAETQIGVKKVWYDADDQDGIRPSSITVQLLANGDSCGDAIELSAENNWSYEWTGLPKKDAGRDIKYTVDETSELPEGYTKLVTDGETTDGETTGFVIINSYTPETTQISVLKVWADADDADAKRPNRITVQLFADGNAYGDAVELSTANNWSYEWNNLPKKSAGLEIKYTVDETSELPEGYTKSVSGDASTGYVITNTYNKPEATPTSTTEPTATPTTEPTVTPTTEPTVTPTTEPTETPTTEPTETPTTEPTEAPTTEPTETPTTEPTEAPTTEPTEAPTTEPTEAPTMEPTEAPTAEPTATPTAEPTATPTAEPTATPTTEPTAEPTATPTAAPTAEPIATANPTVTPAATPEPTPTVTPTPTPEPQYVSVSGHKTWVDNNDEAGRRPSSITVRLLRNGVVIQETTVTAASGWFYSFNDLPAADPVTGEAYVYTIAERMVHGYYGRVDGNDLTNTLVGETTTPGIPHDPDDPLTRMPNYNTPLGVRTIEMTEQDLEGVLTLFDYGTPLWGGLLGTGDEVPIYPYIFSATGAAALLALLVLNRKKKRQY